MSQPSVKYESGSLVLQDNGTWSVQGEVDPHDLIRAREMFDDYRYNPGDGYPGYALVIMVAEETGGEPVLPPMPPMPEGALP